MLSSAKLVKMKTFCEAAKKNFGNYDVMVLGQLAFGLLTCGQLACG